MGASKTHTARRILVYWKARRHLAQRPTWKGKATTVPVGGVCPTCLQVIRGG